MGCSEEKVGTKNETIVLESELIKEETVFYFSVKNISDNDVKLTFSNGQEYDFTIVNNDGKK